MDAKVGPQHLRRLAGVYVRQSSMHQVREHRASAELQYDLVERAVALGWPRKTVRIYDGDQGTTGSIPAQRAAGGVVLEADPNHWRGAPAIKTVVFRPIPDDDVRIIALQNGDARAGALMRPLTQDIVIQQAAWETALARGPAIAEPGT